MKCYPVPSGVEGLMPDGSWQLFATDTDYFEAYEEAEAAQSGCAESKLT